MASIEKIYLSKEKALQFIDYLKSIDNDYKAFFTNSCSIFEWVIFDKECILKWEPENSNDEFPVTHFPECVDAWLLRRDDLPQYARDYIAKFQYSQSIVNGHLTKEPIVFENFMHGTPFSKFKIVYRNGCFSTTLKPSSRYYISLLDNYANAYVEDEDIWCNSDVLNAYLVGKDYSHYACINAKSYKALIRKLKKWKFPKGTIIKIEDFKYEGEIIIKCL